MKYPEGKSTFYSINEGNAQTFSPDVKSFLGACKEGDKPYSLRYTGSMVADVHRTLLYGGVFLYPATTSAPAGKLRLLYEVNPMSRLFEEAGGRGGSIEVVNFGERDSARSAGRGDVSGVVAGEKSLGEGRVSTGGIEGEGADGREESGQRRVRAPIVVGGDLDGGRTVVDDGDDRVGQCAGDAEAGERGAGGANEDLAAAIAGRDDEAGDDDAAARADVHDAAAVHEFEEFHCRDARGVVVAFKVLDVLARD
jgi:hypothetical protein